MIYKILTFENVTTSTGKSMKKLSLEGTDGVHNLNIFSDFPHYAELTFGSTIDGEIKKNQKGYDTLYSNEIKQRNGAYNTNKEASMTKVMEKKAENIEKAQENRAEGVRVSATMRDAVILATTEFKDKTVLDNLDESVLKWRKWLWKHWDDPITDATYPD